MKRIVFGLALSLTVLGATGSTAEAQEKHPAAQPGLALDAARPIASFHVPAPLDERQMSLAEALRQLATRTELQLVYSPSMVEGTRVSCACDAAGTTEALDALLAGTDFRWVRADGQILIERRPLAPIPSTSAASIPAHLASLSVGNAPAFPGGAMMVGTITGRVVEAGTLRPLSGAQVTIANTTQGALTNAEGRFLLLNVPDGSATVRVQIIGFSTVEQTVTVQPGTSATVDFQLQQEALALDAVVVTGTAGVTRRRELGNAVTQIDAAIAETQPIENVSDLLRGRAAGVVVHGGQGSVGTATTIKIRGSSTMRLTNDGPLLYIDGVRVNNQMTEVGGASISRIDDLDPANIESVEVIKGPAAATLYGTEASNGVINITTKRGAIGATEWTVTTRQGANWLHNAEDKVPVNWGVNPQTGQIETVNLVESERALGNDVFSVGRTQYYGLSVGGGTSDLQYFVSGSASDEEGATLDNFARSYNARANLNAAPTENITLQVNAGVMLNRIRLPASGLTNSLFRGSPRYLGTPSRGFRIAPPEAYYEHTNATHEANRMTAGLNLSHNPTEWFTHRLTFGMDITDQANTSFTPRLSPETAQFFSQRVAAGSKSVDRESVLYSSADYGATVTAAVTPAFTSSTSAGLQVYSRSTKFTEAEGEGFPAPGIETIGGAGFRTGSDDFIENNTVGAYIQEQVGWRDRLFVTAAVRADDNSAFGEEFSLVYYPKVSASWVLSDEDFWGLDFVNSLRLRAAYGESGQQPDAYDALRSYAPRQAPDGSSTVRPDTPGNLNLGPERGKEIEVGFDAAFLNDRLSLALTYYDKVTADAIVARDVAPSSGFSAQQFVNIGEVSNRGVEVSLDALVIDSDDFDWNLQVGTATNRNRITELGLDGYLQLGWTTRHAEGYPVGSFFAPNIIQAELNEDGEAINILCDDGQGGGVGCDVAPWLFAGHPDPNVEGSITNAITLFDRVTVQALVDYKFGQSKYSTQMWWRYASDKNTEMNFYPERFDPREVAAAQLGNFGEFQWWVPKANFARLREVSLAYAVPTSLAQRLGAGSGRISIAARNLGVWTNYLPYPYQDPEVLNPIDTFSDNREPQDTSGMPPLTSLELTFQLGF